jgi:hypothetical protein
VEPQRRQPALRFNPLDRSQREHSAHRSDQPVVVKRLDQMPVEARRPASLNVVGAPETRDRQHPDRMIGETRSKRGEHRETVHAWHSEVAENDLWPLLLRDRQPVATVSCRVDRRPQGFEHLPQRVPAVCMILDDEDPDASERSGIHVIRHGC